MRSAGSVMEPRKDHRHVAAGPNPRTPKAFGRRPTAFVPHPPLISGGWYQRTDHEVDGPGRCPVRRPVEKSAKVALRLTLVFGPLGLCYLSTVGGLAAAAVGAATIAFGGVAMVAVIWPVAMVLALLALPRR